MLLLNAPARPRSPVSTIDQNVIFRALRQQRMSGDSMRAMVERNTRASSCGVRPGRQRGFLRATQTRRGDKLHRARDLLGVFHRADAAPEIEKCGH